MTKGLKFEWDPRKANENYRKHKVSFEEAATVFGDEIAITIPDPEHSDDEDREITIGSTVRYRLIVVSHTDRDGIIRIISARKANQAENRQYQGE